MHVDLCVTMPFEQEVLNKLWRLYEPREYVEVLILGIIL